MNDNSALSTTALPIDDPDRIGLLPGALDRLTAVMQREVDARHIPGVSMMIARRGKVGYRRDLGALRPIGPPLGGDAIFRIYSMTKPIVSVAAMMLVEEGRLFIADHIAKFVPAFASVRVGIEKNGKLKLVEADRPITIQDLLRHTSGLPYAFTGKSAVQRLYAKAQLLLDDGAVPNPDLNNADAAAALAKLPLINQPGTTWDYGHSTDVVGRIIEIVSGQTLATFVTDRILKPLGMNDTAFFVPKEKRARLAEAFAIDPDSGKPVKLNPPSPPRFEAAGSGLFSTVEDYARFARLLYFGGALGDLRLIGRKTLAFMTADHLGPDVRISNSNLLPPGHGFGLGFAVRRETGMAPTPGTVGEYFWGGMAGTAFWIAPAEELIALMMIQGPGQRDHFRFLFRNLVHAALA